MGVVQLQCPDWKSTNGMSAPGAAVTTKAQTIFIAPDCSQSEAFTQRLHHNQIAVFVHERGSTASTGGEVHIGFVYCNNTLETGFFQNARDCGKGNQSASWISWGAQEYNFYRRVGGHGFTNLAWHNKYMEAVEPRVEEAYLIDLRLECTSSDIQRDLDDVYIVDIGSDSVHPISRRGGQYLVLSGDTAHADKKVYNFVRSHTKEYMISARNISQICDLGFDLVMTRIGVPVQWLIKIEVSGL
jgi:hypothetical protein